MRNLQASDANTSSCFSSDNDEENKRHREFFYDWYSFL